MIRTLLFTTLILMAAGSSPGQTNPPATLPGGAQEIAALEQTWADAVKRRDAEAIDRIQSPDYVFTGPGGRVWNKTEALATIKAGDLEIDSFELSDLNVRVYGDAAVVTFRVAWQGRFRGQDISGPQRMTDVFVKRDGRWQCVASQATRIQGS